MLDISCGGHLVAGDDSMSGVLRELQEELGLDVCQEDLTFLYSDKISTRPAPDFINNSFNDIYVLYTDKTLAELRPQSSEISELIYVTPDELRSLLLRQGTELVPHEKWYYTAIDLAEKQSIKHTTSGCELRIITSKDKGTDRKTSRLRRSAVGRGSKTYE